jgi:AraC family transcriptional regulator
MHPHASHVPLVSLDMLAAQGVAVRNHLHALELDVYDLSTSAPVSFPRHRHDLAHFSFLMCGELAWWGTGKRHEQSPWLGHFHPPAVEHSVFLGGGTRCFTVVIGPRWIERLHEHADLPPSPVELDEASRPAATRLLHELRNLQPCSLLVIEGLTAELLASAARCAGPERAKPLWMDGLFDRLRSEFHLPLRLNELAMSMNVHPGRLSRSFRKTTGKTIGDHVRGLRVQFLLRELADGDQPVAELALAAGYFDQSHCTREFRRATGMTPGEYRNLARCRPATTPNRPGVASARPFPRRPGPRD